MTETKFAHTTVLLEEAVELLDPREGKVIVDGTLGGGGHSERLLERGATVFGIDRDPRARGAASERLARFGPRFTALAGNYAELAELLSRQGVAAVDGVLLDLGISSAQIDEAERGFSFQKDGPLDMRMSDEGETAALLIERLDERSLADGIYRFGEEGFSRPIARELKKARPRTTFEAVDAVKRAVPRRAWPTRVNVATKTFQALRMMVNEELEGLERALKAVPALLKVGGRFAIISFHSLEDRLVKETFRDLVGRCICPPGLPVCGCGAKSEFSLLTRKAVAASDDEVERNPRARSAHLRAVEKRG